MTIRLSTYFCNSIIPSLALFIFLFPSISKGFVTTPTVKIPKSLAIRATTGVAPVPVPPPIPAVRNTM